MNTPAQTQLLRRLPVTIILPAKATAQPAPLDELTTVCTPDQREVETEAIELFNSLAVEERVAQ